MTAFYVAFDPSSRFASAHKDLLGSLPPARFSERIGNAMKPVALALSQAFRAEGINANIVVKWGFFGDWGVPCVWFDVGVSTSQCRGTFFSFYSGAPGFERPFFRGHMNRDAVIEWLAEFAKRFRGGLPQPEARSFEFLVRCVRLARKVSLLHLIKYGEMLDG